MTSVPPLHYDILSHASDESSKEDSPRDNSSELSKTQRNSTFLPINVSSSLKRRSFFSFNRVDTDVPYTNRFETKTSKDSLETSTTKKLSEFHLQHSASSPSPIVTLAQPPSPHLVNQPTATTPPATPTHHGGIVNRMNNIFFSSSHSLRRKSKHIQDSRRDEEEFEELGIPFKDIFDDADQDDTALDRWSSKTRVLQRWPELSNLPATTSMIPQSVNYCLEVVHSNNLIPGMFILEEQEKYIHYYKLFFLYRGHKNYVAEEETLGPLVITVEKLSENLKSDKKRRRLRVLIRSRRSDERAWVPSNIGTRKGLIALKPEFNNIKFTKSSSDALITDLILFDKKHLPRKCSKIGVLYCRPSQTNETEWYNNEKGSHDFEEFLEFLGEKVSLQGWRGYRGGLDVTNNSTGTHSIYTNYHGMEMMFHVSTLLPYRSDDLQQLERKRHIGNDIVLVLFRERDCSDYFSPTQIYSQFNHVFLVVQKVASDPTHYRVCVGAKLGVQPFGPQITCNGIYKKSTEFRSFILTKILNGERAAMYAPDFKQTMQQTRKEALKGLVDQYSRPKKSKKLLSGANIFRKTIH
eukprot:TRINITY_DN6008_c0_g1_i1.p1 TRINITY_DN6008_c0_g1~~TRINITY_DN6008_c0_g1_i1.p1  ORF type:complete len:594 (+),score=96.42 TRINITY_DN6008_c0_g1_i1:48-1784(+)